MMTRMASYQYPIWLLVTLSYTHCKKLEIVYPLFCSNCLLPLLHLVYHEYFRILLVQLTGLQQLPEQLPLSPIQRHMQPMLATVHKICPTPLCPPFTPLTKSFVEYRLSSLHRSIAHIQVHSLRYDTTTHVFRALLQGSTRFSCQYCWPCAHFGRNSNDRRSGVTYKTYWRPEYLDMSSSFLHIDQEHMRQSTHSLG